MPNLLKSYSIHHYLLVLVLYRGRRDYLHRHHLNQQIRDNLLFLLQQPPHLHPRVLVPLVRKHDVLYPLLSLLLFVPVILPLISLLMLPIVRLLNVEIHLVFFHPLLLFLLMFVLILHLVLQVLLLLHLRIV